MNATLVSIIIPTFNMSNLIGETIQSCLDQTYPNIEIIVVDDGSTDDTSTVVNRFSRNGVKYVWQKNHGAPAAARNHGTQISRGIYLQFLDADDLIHKDKIAIQVKQIENSESALTVSYCDYLFFKLKGCNKIYRRLGPAHFVDWKSSINTQLQQYTVVHRFLFPKSTLTQFGGFDESMNQCEDLDLWMRLLINDVPFQYIDLPMAYYRESIGLSVSNPKGQIYGHLKIIDKLFAQMITLGICSSYSDQLTAAAKYWNSQLSQFNQSIED